MQLYCNQTICWNNNFGFGVIYV